jgi:hypothetical protein
MSLGHIFVKFLPQEHHFFMWDAKNEFLNSFANLRFFAEKPKCMMKYDNNASKIFFIDFVVLLLWDV